jgi:putative addiction module CopG family antidote
MIKQNNSDMETVPAKITKRIVMEMEELIDQGWYANKSELIRDAIRELIKKQKVTQLESAIKEDIQWGLYGK